MPVDLIVPLVFAIVAASVYVAGGIIVNPDTPLAFAVMFALVFYATPGVFRAAWLVSGWRARRDTVRRPRWLIADESVVAWRSDTVRRRSPTLIGFAGLGLIYLLPVWWWWCAMRELRDFGRAHDVRELAGLNPAVEAALMAGAWFLVPPFITLLQAPRRVRAAQVAAGLERPLDTRIVWLSPIVPLFCMLLQRELNRIWDAQVAVPAGQLSTK